MQNVRRHFALPGKKLRVFVGQVDGQLLWNSQFIQIGGLMRKNGGDSTFTLFLALIPIRGTGGQVGKPYWLDSFIASEIQFFN